MRALLLISLAISVAATLPAAAQAAPGADTSAATAARLGNKIHARIDADSGSGTHWGRATAVVNAPTQQVLKVVQNYAEYEKFMPHFKQSRVLNQRGYKAIVYMQCGILKDTVTLWGQLKMSGKSEGESQVVQAKMTKGNMDQFAAVWHVTPLDGGKRTLVDFKILVEPDLPFPYSVFSVENRKAARSTIKALRKRVKAR